MTREQVIHVQATWQEVLPIADLAADLFYERLFEIDPNVKALFTKTDLSQQKRTLLQALAATIARLNDPDAVARQLQDLGGRHATYGVEAHHYALVGEALLWTLEKGLDDRWSPEIQQAWTAAYAMIAQQMLEGAGAVPSNTGRGQHHEVG
ncbi:MAG: globin family protein [Devosia sp.]